MKTGHMYSRVDMCVHTCPSAHRHCSATFQIRGWAGEWQVQFVSAQASSASLTGWAFLGLCLRVSVCARVGGVAT